MKQDQTKKGSHSSVPPNWKGGGEGVGVGGVGGGGGGWGGGGGGGGLTGHIIKIASILFLYDTLRLGKLIDWIREESYCWPRFPK